MSKPCDECGAAYNEEYYAGCCRDGRCSKEREFLCSSCGTYDDTIECILCPTCLYNYDTVFEEDKEFISVKDEKDEREKMTLEEQREMCGETFDEREARHLAEEQTDIFCLECKDIIWKARYDSNKSLAKLLDGGCQGYLCYTCYEKDHEEDDELIL